MSSALAVAGVSAVLRDLLNDGFVNHNVSGALGTSVLVTNLPPDRIVNGSPETTQLNLFLRQLSPNSGWRNEGLPSRDDAGRTRLSNPPLALNLHYLISAYGAEDLHAEILLGYAMQLLHENPVIPRNAIRIALQPSPAVGTALPLALRALADSGLQDQVEQLRITLEYLNNDEISNFWNATKSHFRPSVACRISVVLIQAVEPARTPLPVLSRQSFVRPDLMPQGPTLEAIVPDARQPVAQFDTVIALTGQHLDGSAREVVLFNDRFAIDATRAASPGNLPTEIQFSLPVASAADFPVGIYRVGGRLLRAGESTPRETNQLAMTLAPTITSLPTSPVSRDASGTARFPVGFLPSLRVGQKVVLVLGQREHAPDPFTPPGTTLNFTIADAPIGDHLVRLRVDGIDSPIIDRLAEPPAFLDQRIVFQ